MLLLNTLIVNSYELHLYSFPNFMLRNYMNQIFHRLSLKTKVSLSTLVIFIASIWVLTSYASNVLRENLIKLIHEQQFTAVSIVASDINDELDERFRVLKKAASKINPTTLGNATSLQSFLEDRISLDMAFNSGVFVSKINGTVVANVPSSINRVGKNFSDRDWMTESLKGKSSIGKPVIGSLLKVPIFTMSVPIRDPKGKVIGVLAGVVDLSKPSFLNKITDNRYGKTGGYVLIAPQHKLFVTATDKSYIMKPIPAPGINPLMDSYIQGFEGSGSIVDARGLAVLSSAKQIPAAGWTLVVRIPHKEAFAPIKAMQNRMFISAFILTLFASALTWSLLKRQLSPVFDTLKTLSAITDKNLPVTPLPIVKHDEVGQLIGGFNHLIRALADSERFLKTIINSEPECIKMLDINGNILMMNSAGLEMVEADTFEQVEGKCVCPLITDPYREDFLALTKQVFQGFSGKLEFETIGLKGRRVWLETHAVPFRNDQGVIVSLLGITRDITERKQAEIDREEALARVKKLEGIIPICMYCKKIRDDLNSWNQLEQYITNHSEAMFSHGICPQCLEEHFDPDTK